MENAAKRLIRALLPVLLLFTAPIAAAAQAGAPGSEPEFRALVRTGLRLEGADPAGGDGFELYDARFGIRGEAGVIFEYELLGAFDATTGRFGLLDAVLALPVLPEGGRIELGRHKPPFGRERLQGKGEITFVDRAQVSQALVPGRDLGVQVAGELMEGRLAYGAGVFNGGGAAPVNRDDDYLYAARLRYNTVGPVSFYDDFLVEIGASVAFSSDSAADLTSGGRFGASALDLAAFTGDRTLWGVDLRMSYLGFFVRGEYLRAELDPEPLVGPAPGPPDGSAIVSEGGYVEGGYDIYGAAEVVLRYDGMRGVVTEPGTGDFLVGGFFVSPGYVTRVGLQYAEGLGDSTVGAGIADGQFALLAQVAF